MRGLSAVALENWHAFAALCHLATWRTFRRRSLSLFLNLSIDFTSLLETGRYGYYLLFF